MNALILGRWVMGINSSYSYDLKLNGVYFILFSLQKSFFSFFFFDHIFTLIIVVFPYFRCQHYRRRCFLRAPCCNEIYSCRHCHNEATVIYSYPLFLFIYLFGLLLCIYIYIYEYTQHIEWFMLSTPSIGIKALTDVVILVYVSFILSLILFAVKTRRVVEYDAQICGYISKNNEFIIVCL